MNINGPLSEYFIAAGAPVILQTCVISILFMFNWLCAHQINKSMTRFTFASLFIYLDMLYLVPFFISQTNGLAGFASAHGVSAYGFNLKMFSLYIVQLTIIPLVLLSFYSRLGQRLYEAHFRSKFLFYIFTMILACYVLAYLITVKPGIYHAIVGDFQKAKDMRVAAVLGNTSEVSGVSRFFDFKNLFVWLLQAVLLSYLLGSKKWLNTCLLFALFILLAFINFSKGALVGSILMLIWAGSYKSKYLSYYPLIFLFVVTIAVLVSYTFFFHVNGIKLESAFAAIFRRIYNNSSSVYLQLNLFESLVPNFLYIQDWGKVGDLIGVDPMIPKEMVYQEFYSGEGQGGSTFISEMYFAFGWGGVILVPFTLLPIVIIDKLLHCFRTSHNQASNWVSGMLLFWGTIFTLGIQASPFKIFNIFTILRIEYFAIIVLVLLMIKVKVIKK